MRPFLLCLLALSAATSALAQQQIKLQISRRDSLGEVDTAYFGVDTRATNCIDSSLGEYEIWWQACGLVTCLVFVDFFRGEGSCLGIGTSLDLRPYYSPTQVDTYQLKFDGYPPNLFHWQPDIGTYYGSMTLMNSRDTSAATIKVNMVTQDSFI